MNLRSLPAIRSLQEELPVPSEFRDPPPGYGPLPFWFWNARLDEAEVRRQVREMVEKGCSGAFLHARHGLQTPYLGEEWLHLVRAAAEEAAARGFQLWLYDDVNWPSGTAGGGVAAVHPELRARYLRTTEIPVDGETLALSRGDLPEGEFLGAWALRLDAWGEPCGPARRLPPDPAGGLRVIGGECLRLLLFTVCDGSHVDVLNPAATDRFLRLTLERYAASLGRLLGSVVPGIFMAEAMPLSVGGVPDRPALPWSPLLPRAFRERRGYDLIDHLPALAAATPEAARVRCDYFETLAHLYTRNFLQPIREWCANHGIALAGRVLYEAASQEKGGRGEGEKGRRGEGEDGRHSVRSSTHSPVHPFTRSPIPHRLAASVAHQNGLPRVLSEAFGAAGWGSTLAQRKASVDWQLANGINLIVPHAVYYTVYGKRKRESPPSEFEQEAFWPHYRAFADYVARLSFLLTRGKHAARIAVLLPLRSAWAHFTPGCQAPAAEEGGQVAFASCGSADRLLLARVERDLFALCDLLSALHFDFDLVDEQALSEARIERSRMSLGMERYELLVIPTMTTCAEAAWERVRAFFDAGGNVFSCGLLPFQTGEGADADARLRAAVEDLTTVDPTLADRPGGSTARALGRDAMRPLKVNREHGSRVARYLPARVPLADHRALLMETLLRTLVAVDVDIACPDLVCHQRETADGKLFFVANAGDETREANAVFYALGHPEEWDPETGEIRRVWQYRRSGEKVTLPLRFAPRQTRVVVFTGRDDLRVERANFVVTSIVERDEDHLVEGVAASHARPMDTPPNCSMAWPGGGRWAEGFDKGILEPIRLGEVWDLRVLGDNYLVLPDWRWHAPRPGQDAGDLAAFREDWPELPAREPISGSPNLDPLEGDLPGEAWFQTRFYLDAPVRVLSLLLEPLDVPYTVLMNGEEVAPVETGVLDPRFLTADIAHLAVEGENVVALRVSYAGARPAALDHLHRITCDLVPEPARLLGDFTVVPDEDASFRVYPGAPPRIGAGSWTEQGFPHYSGTLEYSQPVTVARDYFDFQLVLAVENPADIVEVLVNGKRAGCRPWPPYEVDVSDLLFTGTNLVTLRVTNTAANALLGRQQPSGLLGPVEIRPYARLSVVVPKA